MKGIFYALQKIVSTAIYPLIRFREGYFPRNQARILMYHSISKFPREMGVPYDNVPVELFKTQMEILNLERYNVISLSSLVRRIRMKQHIPPKTIVITFDDGYKNNYLNALPILKRTGLCATFFLIATAIGKTNPFEHLLWDSAARKHYSNNPESRLPLDWRETKEILEYGMEIGCHGLSHRSIGYLAQGAAHLEVVKSKEILEDALSITIKHFSYPFGSKAYGDFNVRTHSILTKAGYESACTTEIGSVHGNSPIYELKRVPIRETDNSFFFRQKISGACDWVNSAKTIFQKHTQRIDKV